MNALRRPGVVAWLALVVVGGAGVAIGLAKKFHPGDRTGHPAIEAAITRVITTVDGPHRRLRIDFTVRHHRPTALVAGPPDVRLLGAADEPMPEFFAPGAFPPAVPPGVTTASWGEYWLTEFQAAGPLTLEVAGRRLPVPTQK